MLACGALDEVADVAVNAGNLDVLRVLGDAAERADGSEGHDDSPVLVAPRLIASQHELFSEPSRWMYLSSLLT